MKPIGDVEKTRREYHGDAQKNTVHRSSLMAPRLPGTDVDISFVNHFLLKRGHENVACRLTAVDPEGQRVESRTFQVCEPRVYAFELSSLTNAPVANYIVEFFSPSNLFIPFPAVVVNHRNARFLNSVHSYNRVLNDVFEDDAINSTRVREASVDVRVDEATDTFALFTAGPTPCRGAIEVIVKSPGGILEAKVPVDLPRFSNQMVSLRSLFGKSLDGAVLTMRQPSQFLFYGRMLAGLRCEADGAIGANHSFYDCSEVEEYWDDGRPSSRVYPLLEGFRARIRLYPIFSPCRLLSAVDFFDASGHLLKTVECEPLCSPSEGHLDFTVRDAMTQEGVEGATSFQYRAWPDGGKTPRRINHQIVYEDEEGRSPLAASAAISLKNPSAFAPGGKKGLTWGQCAIGADLDSRLGIVLDHANGRTERVTLRLIGESGEAFRKEVDLPAGSAYVIDPAELVPELTSPSGERPHYLWYWATCERPDLSAYTVTRHRQSGHCTGDHSF